MLEEYPKKVTLKDGAVLTLRTMTRDDEHGVYMFFSSLPEEARRYLRNDVTNRKIIARWMRDLPRRMWRRSSASAAKSRTRTRH